jgi:23S rRNA (cytosine1962-C5)-methyltransferase
MKAAVYLHQAREGAARLGHPWIFPKAIARHKGELLTGNLVDVFTANGELIGVGVYNEHSLYRIRLLSYAFEQVDTSSFTNLIMFRLKQALKLRENLRLPNKTTNAYRLFNSEGDGLSGLTVDKFNDYIIVASSAYWVEAQRELITQSIHELFSPKELIWFSQAKPLSQDGWKESAKKTTAGKTEVLEAGVRYQIDFSNTQKTGLFLDQRENHERIAQLAHNKRVLDLYTYTGGFALHAAKALASKVTAVDSSSQAIALAKENAKLNQLHSIEFIEADARDYLAKAYEYDLVILDPPKLVPSQRHLQQAKNYYRFLHREAFKYMRPGSLLLTCNCSSALSATDFTELVSAQAPMSNKIARILGVYGPASCHPTLAAFREGQYLTAVLFSIT